jgi:hypothetical protein
MLAIFAMQLIQFALASYFQKSHQKTVPDDESEMTQPVTNSGVEGPSLNDGNLHIEQNCLHTHEHGISKSEPFEEKRDLKTKIEKRTTVFLLESGIGPSLIILTFSNPLCYHWVCLGRCLRK